MIGFGAYQATRRNFFGPTGVRKMSGERESAQTALLLACLRGVHDMGYAYGIIGGAGRSTSIRRPSARP